MYVCIRDISTGLDLRFTLSSFGPGPGLAPDIGPLSPVKLIEIVSEMILFKVLTTHKFCISMVLSSFCGFFLSSLSRFNSHRFSKMKSRVSKKSANLERVLRILNVWLSFVELKKGGSGDIKEATKNKRKDSWKVSASSMEIQLWTVRIVKKESTTHMRDTNSRALPLLHDHAEERWNWLPFVCWNIKYCVSSVSAG